MKSTSRAWKNSHSFGDFPLDLTVDASGARAFTLARSMAVRDEKNRVVSVYHPTKELAERAAAKAVASGKSIKVETGVLEIPSIHTRFILRVAKPEALLAAKMCLSLSTLLSNSNSNDSVHARLFLLGDASAMRWAPIVWLYPSIDARRPSLAHSIYVERSHEMVLGLVQFFGIIQIGMVIGQNTEKLPPAAAFAYLDPVTGAEQFDVELDPIPIDFGPTLTQLDLERGMRRWLKLFRTAAIDRQAAKPPNLDGKITCSGF